MNAETAAHLARTVGKKASFAYLNGDSYTFEFLAPDVLLNMNDRTHWRKKAVQVKNWRTATADRRSAWPSCKTNCICTTSWCPAPPRRCH